MTEDNELRPLLNECIEILKHYADYEVDERTLDRCTSDGTADTAFQLNEAIRKKSYEWLSSKQLL